jgi:predicted ATP-grasp superfamily ATP-dependent carboligase
MWSRYARARAVVPDSIADPAEFATAVAERAERCGPLVVYPGREEAIDALLPTGSLPSGSALPYPRLDGLTVLRDKRSLPEVARAARLATPALLARGSAREVEDADVAFPCVVKSALPGGAPSSALPVRTRQELRAALAPLADETAVVVQEHVAGPLAAVGLVVASDGSVVARFQQLARRIWPPEAGVSVVATSVAPDAGLVDAAARVLREAEYAGLAQMQFILGPDGPVLLDVNPRFYGSLPLALRAGVNLPAAWHAVAIGDAASAPAPYRTGVNYHWLEGDLIAARRNGSLRSLRPPRRPRTGAFWAPDDPLPSALLTAAEIADRTRARPSGCLHG